MLLYGESTRRSRASRPEIRAAPLAKTGLKNLLLVPDRKQRGGTMAEFTRSDPHVIAWQALEPSSRPAEEPAEATSTADP